jgi:hypothetical protein
MNTEPTKNETLFGGADFIATHTDGATESVKIAQIPIKDFPKFLQVQDDELKMAEFFCGKPEGWASSLSLDSLEGIITEGERINADFFSRWVQRRIARQERLIPGLTQKALSALPTGAQK